MEPTPTPDSIQLTLARDEALLLYKILDEIRLPLSDLDKIKPTYLLLEEFVGAKS